MVAAPKGPSTATRTTPPTGRGGAHQRLLEPVEEHRQAGPCLWRPEKFCSDISKTNWESATITTLDGRIPPYIQKMCKRDPFSGKVVTGGIITVKDSSC